MDERSVRIADGAGPRRQQPGAEPAARNQPAQCRHLRTAAAPLAYQLDAAEKRILHISNAALLRIFSCAYAYRATGDRKYLDHAENDINTVCAFPDSNGHRHYLDVGEMAAAVALGYDRLYAGLKPETRANAERALREYAFDTAADYGSSFYNKVSKAGTRVCNAGRSAARWPSTRRAPRRPKAIIEKSLESNRTAVRSPLRAPRKLPRRVRLLGVRYGIRSPDAYGARNRRRVRRRHLRHSRFRPHGRMAALHGRHETPRIQLRGYPSVLGQRRYSEWYFADRFKKPSILYFNKRNLDALTTDYYNRNHRLLPMIMVFAGRVDLNSVTPPTQKVRAGEGVTPVVLVHTDWTWSDTDKYLGIKGGKARSSHAHMDAGSFVYDAYGVRWSMDIGRQASPRSRWPSRRWAETSGPTPRRRCAGRCRG